MKLFILIVLALSLQSIFACSDRTLIHRAWSSTQVSRYNDIFTAEDTGSDKNDYYNNLIEEKFVKSDSKTITIGDYRFEIIRSISSISTDDLEYIDSRYKLSDYRMNSGIVVKASFYSPEEEFDMKAYVAFAPDEESGSCNHFGVAGPLYVF